MYIVLYIYIYIYPTRSRAAYPPPRLLLAFYLVMLEICPKILNNSTQHRPKSIKNPSKINQKIDLVFDSDFASNLDQNPPSASAADPPYNRRRAGAGPGAGLA